MEKNNLTETITFRVSEKTKEKFNELALRQNKTTNEWCRDITIEAAGERHGLTPANEILLAEIYSLRRFLESIFDAQLNSELNNETFIEIVTDSVLDRKQLLRKYFQKEMFENENLDEMAIQYEERTNVEEVFDKSINGNSHFTEVSENAV